MRALNVAGRVLLALGVTVLLFTAYQLWGTGLGEQHAQSVLGARLATELPHGSGDVARRLSSASRTAVPALQIAPPAAAPAPGQPIGRIDIPSIGLDQVVVEGVATTDLRMGPGHYPGTPLPGEAGNAAIAGHRTTYAHPFYSLDAVAPGDQILLTTTQGVFVYTATGQQVVAPTDLAVIADTTTPTLTLTTCNPRYSAATRLVLHADLTRSHLFAASSGAHPPGAKATRAPSSTGKAGPRHQAGAGRLAGAGGSVAAAAGWGAAVAAVVVATLLAAGRVAGRRRRWAVQAAGSLACLAVLFFFFGAVSPLLPASF